MSETWVTKQLLPDLQAVREVTFSGEKVVFIIFNMDYGCLRQRTWLITDDWLLITDDWWHTDYLITDYWLLMSRKRWDLVLASSQHQSIISKAFFILLHKFYFKKLPRLALFYCTDRLITDVWLLWGGGDLSFHNCPWHFINIFVLNFHSEDLGEGVAG